MSRPGHDVAIRAATVEDAADVHGLVVELAKATQLEDKFRSAVDDYRRHGLREGAMFEALVAERDGLMVGAALYFYTFSTWRGEPGVYLQDLVVTQSARGQRIGKRLLAELARAARARGATHLRLAVDNDNTEAMRFYERCGMNKVESDCVFEIQGDAFERLGGAS